MQKPTQGIKPDQIIDIILKRRWFIIIPFCIAMIAGICLSIILPKVYEAETLILVQPQKVPSNYVQSIVSTDIDARISTISQQILSRTNLEKIIKDFKLFSGSKYEKMFIEDKIDNLRKRIFVEVSKEKARRNAETYAFTISFKGKEPEKVMRIVNTLANYFINENLKTREAQAIGTSDFLDDELKNMRKRLENLEAVLKSYREKFMGGLPEQLETNLRVLDRLQEQVSSKQEALRDAKNQLITLENQMQAESQLKIKTSKMLSEANGEPVIDDNENLTLLQIKLADLKSKYTDKHPDVIRLTAKIADLEGKLNKEDKPSKKNIQAGLPQSKMQIMAAKDKLLRLQQKEELKREISTLKQEIKKILDVAKIYQKRVEETPKREQELLSIKRDYNNVKETYDSLLSRKLEAQIAVNMEKKQKGEQFRIIDPAKLPTKPVEPNMKKLFMMAIAAGFGIGGGLIFLLEYLDSSFKRSDDIEAYLELPVLAAIPALYQPKDKKWKRMNNLFSMFFIMISIALFAGFALMTIKGVDQTMELAGKFIK